MPVFLAKQFRRAYPSLFTAVRADYFIKKLEEKKFGKTDSLYETIKGEYPMLINLNINSPQIIIEFKTTKSTRSVDACNAITSIPNPLSLNLSYEEALALKHYLDNH